MIDCLILGDSIAVGTHRFYNECQMVAKGGINSSVFNKQHSENFNSKNVIISLGSNDYKGIKTLQELKSLRDRVDPNAKVFWIVPAIKPHIQDIVKLLAEQNHDTIVYINELQPDKVHPTVNGYKDIVNQIKNGN
jgi:lysophospholipase L1-like esterase